MKYIEDYKKVKSFLGDESNQKELKELVKKPVVKAVFAILIIALLIYLSRHIFKGLAHSVNGFKDLQLALRR